MSEPSIPVEPNEPEAVSEPAPVVAPTGVDPLSLPDPAPAATPEVAPVAPENAPLPAARADKSLAVRLSDPAVQTLIGQNVLDGVGNLVRPRDDNDVRFAGFAHIVSGDHAGEYVSYQSTLDWDSDGYPKTVGVNTYGSSVYLEVPYSSLRPAQPGGR